MKTRFVAALPLICAAFTTPALAQQTAAQAPPAQAVTKQVVALNVSAAKPVQAAKAAPTAGAALVVLADGIVANPVAPVAPPAEGFVYER
jgi:hypothetical protein